MLITNKDLSSCEENRHRQKADKAKESLKRAIQSALDRLKQEHVGPNGFTRVNDWEAFQNLKEKLDEMGKRQFGRLPFGINSDIIHAGELDQMLQEALDYLNLCPDNDTPTYMSVLRDLNMLLTNKGVEIQAGRRTDTDFS